MKLVAKQRNRGPRKKDGGRPKGTVPLYDDADRFVIAAALSLGESAIDQRSIALIQALDNLLTPHEGIEVAPDEARLIDGVEYSAGTIINTTPNRTPDRRNRNVQERKPLSPPGGKTFRRSRLRHLQLKIANFRRAFQRAELSEKEVQWLGLCRFGLTQIVTADAKRAYMGFLTLASAGFQLPEAARQRVVNLLSLR
jgi:hypothetical protein